MEFSLCGVAAWSGGEGAVGARIHSKDERWVPQWPGVRVWSIHLFYDQAFPRPDMCPFAHLPPPEQGLCNGRASARLSVPSPLDSSNGDRRVCCRSYYGQEISNDSCGRALRAPCCICAGAQQQMLAAWRWQATEETERRPVRVSS